MQISELKAFEFCNAYRRVIDTFKNNPPTDYVACMAVELFVMLLKQVGEEDINHWFYSAYQELYESENGNGDNATIYDYFQQLYKDMHSGAEWCFTPNNCQKNVDNARMIYLCMSINYPLLKEWFLQVCLAEYCQRQRNIYENVIK